MASAHNSAIRSSHEKTHGATHAKFSLKRTIRLFLFNRLLTARARCLSPYVLESINGCSSLLDFGCGDMFLTRSVHSQTSIPVTGVDTVDSNLTNLPLVLYDGITLPFEAKSFDASMVAYALHHCQDIEGILRELSRVTSKRIIIFEEIYQGPFGKGILTLHDFGNRLLSTKMDIPLKFMTIGRWNDLFKSMGFVVERCRRIRQYPMMNATHQVMFEIAVGKTAVPAI